MAIQSVQRALRILDFYSPSRTQLGITEISHLIGLPKTTVHGLVKTLVEEGFLQQDSKTKKYTLGLKIYELSTYLLSSLKINQMGLEPVSRLSKKTKLMSRIGIFDQDSVLVTANFLPDSDYNQFNIIGPRVPCYCSAMGKSILSEMSDEEISAYLERTTIFSFTKNTVTDRDSIYEEIKEVKKNGYARENEEYINNLSCIAVPVFDNTGEAIASISVSGFFAFFDSTELDRIIMEVKQAGMEVSRRMGYFVNPINGF